MQALRAAGAVRAVRARAFHALFALVLAAAFAVPPARASVAVYVEPELQAKLAVAAATDRLIAVVNFDPAATTSATLAAAVQNLGAGTLSFEHLDSLGVLGTPAQLKLVAVQAGVTEMYANAPLQYMLDGGVPSIGANSVWRDLGFTGKGVGVAVIDTGIDGTHPDLAYGTKTVQNVKVMANAADVYAETWGVFSTKETVGAVLYVEGVSNTDTTGGHGTHVAGIAAGTGSASDGRYTGVASGADLIGIGVGDTVAVLWALAGLDYVLDHAREHNIKVVNNSWGSTAEAARWDERHPVNRATRKVHRAGISVVFAAGNDGSADDTMNLYALSPWVIAVAAGCKAPEPNAVVTGAYCPAGGLADFSSRGVAGSAQAHPTLTAPGVNIAAARALSGTTQNALTAWSDPLLCPTQDVLGESGTSYDPTSDDAVYYTCASGTSMAAPHVAGTIALMHEAAAAAGRTLNPDQVKDILVKTVRPMVKHDGTPYALHEAGAGYLDAEAAVLAAAARPTASRKKG